MSDPDVDDVEAARPAPPLPDGLRLEICPPGVLAEVIGFEARSDPRPDYHVPITLRSCLHPSPERLLVIVRDAENRLVASLHTELEHSADARRFLVYLFVDRAWRHRGIGRALIPLADAHVARWSGDRLAADVYGDDPDGLAFAQRAGFREMHRRRRWYLDVRSFDPARFEDPDEIALHARVELTDLAAEVARIGADQVSEMIRTLHMDLLSRASMPFRPADVEIDLYRELFLRGVIEPATLIARQGDRYVGLTLVLEIANGLAASFITGAVGQPGARRAGLALRLRSIARLRDLGYTDLLVAFDLDNHPMRRILRRLGFTPGPEIVRMERRLTSS